MLVIIHKHLNVEFFVFGFDKNLYSLQNCYFLGGFVLYMKNEIKMLFQALHELCELVNNGDVEDVVAALPSWAHFYKILTADTDRKVREMTQVCKHECNYMLW